ncbi:2534_t:CDS:10, partial [Funneliformis caledonium]
MTSMEFPKGFFYIKSADSPSGASTSSPASQNLVVDVERGFFVSWGAIKDGSKTVVALQKSDADHDPYQLWKYEDGWLVNKQTSLCLEAESGKVGNRLILHHRKSPHQAANQRWNINKDGHIALQSHPKHVIDVKGSVKEGASILLADSGSKAFGKSNHAKWTVIALSKKKSRSGGAIGVIRLELVGAKDLKSVDSFLTGGKSDPYVRVFHQGGKDVIAQTKVIDNNLDPEWNEVHYLPVKNIGDKFILEVMDFNTFTKDKTLGQCVFEVTREVVKEVGDDLYEGTAAGIDTWVKLSIKGQIHYKAKFFPLTPLPEPSTDFLANLKEKPFDRSTLFTLITLQSPDGSFAPSNTLANLFGYPDSEAMFSLYRANCHEERVLEINKTIWTTSMVLWFLRYLLKDFRNEWSGAYERAEQYISKEISGDLEIEEIVIASGRKAVRERFDIKTSDPQKTVITREKIKSTHIHRIMKFQLKTNGAFQINDELAKSLSFDNADQLRTALTVHINKHAKNSKITHLVTQVWVNILVLHFLRLVCVEHQAEWKDTYLRSYRWLWGQFKSRESIEQEAFNIVSSYVKERYSVKEDAFELDSQFMKIISEEINSIRKGSREITFGGGIVPAKTLYGIARINIIKAKNLMQADSWFGGGASDPYMKISSVSTGYEYGETRVIYNTINPEWQQVFYIPIYDLNDKFKLQVYDYNAFFKHVLLGYYVLDLKDFIKLLGNGTIEGKHLELESTLSIKGSSKGKLNFTADFNPFSQNETDLFTTTTISKTTITIRHLYLLMTYQRQDGCFELNDNVASLFNFSSKDELIKAFTTYVQKDELVKALHVDVWSSALITALFKALFWAHRREWNTVDQKTETYLSETVTDLETEERLYNLANKFVVEHFKISDWESEEQKRSLGLSLQPKKTINTRRNINVRQVRRYISFQKDTGCFELTDHMSESLGFSSAEEAKKIFETHFASYAKASKLDANVYISAVMIWHMRYVMVDFRGEWADKYKKTALWVSEQVKDEQVEKEVLEAAKIFVMKRFEVDAESIEEDESFEDSLKFKPQPVSHDDAAANDDDFIAGDQVIGLLRIRIKSAKDLPNQSWFGTKPDPYVKILDASSKEIIRTRTNHDTLAPVWEEIHYVSIHGPGEKITFEIMDENLFISDKTLGSYVLDTEKLIGRNEDGSFTAGDLVEQWFSLQIGKIFKGELNMEVQFFSTSFNLEESFIFKRETIDLKHLYILFSWRLTSGSFEFSDNLSRFFNCKSEEELRSVFKKFTIAEERLQTLSQSVLSTALVITYLKLLCWKHRQEWTKIIANSEEWLSLEIDDIELEDKLYGACERFITERFQIKEYEDQQQKCLVTRDKREIITRKSITSRKVRYILNYQTKAGSVPLNNKTTEFFGFESTEEFTKELQTHFHSESVTKVHQDVWVTASTIWFLRYVAVDFRQNWVKVYDQASEYLRVQCNGDSKLEQEILESARNFIIKRHQVDKTSIEDDNSFASAVENKQKAIQRDEVEQKRQELIRLNKRRVSYREVKQTVTVDSVKRYLSHCKEEGGFIYNDDVVELLNFTDSKSFETSIQSHFVSERTSKLDKNIITTAISLYYLRLVAYEHRTEWKSSYEKSSAWLKQQVNNDEVERELTDIAKEFVISTYKVKPDTIEADMKEYPKPVLPTKVKEPTIKPVTVQVTQPKSIVTEAVEKSTYTVEQKRVALVSVQSSTTVEKTKSIISYQHTEGYFKLSEVVSKKLEISEESSIKLIQSYTTDESIKQLTTKAEIVSTALTISYLQTCANQHETHWKVQYEQARKYLKEQIKDVEKEEQILAISKKLVVERATQKVIRKQQRSTLASIQTSTTIEKTKSILSSFKSNHFEWNQTISKKLDVSNNNFVSTCESYATSNKLKDTITTKTSVWQTAIQLHYLKLSASQHDIQWKAQYETARKWISIQIKDAKLEEELMEASYKLYVEKATQKVVVKKKRAALLHIQSKTTVDTAKAICSKQTQEGAFELSEEVCKRIDVSSSESLLTTIKSYDVSEKVKKITNAKIIECATVLAYLKTTASTHESHYKSKYEHAKKWLTSQCNDEELEKEVLSVCSTLVMEKTSETAVRKQKQKEKRIAISHIQSKTDVTTTKKIIKVQKQDGSFSLSNEISQRLDLVSTSTQNIVSSFKSYAVSERVKTASVVNDTVISTALTCSYLSTVASAHKETWKVEYERARKYLREQIKDVELEEEILRSCSKLIVDRSRSKVIYKQKKKEKRTALLHVQSKTTAEHAQSIVSTQKDTGSLELSEVITKNCGISNESVLTSVKTYSTTESLKKVTNVDIWKTAISLNYLENYCTAHESTWKVQYKKAREYLSIQIKDKKVEEELLEAAKKVVIHKTTTNVVRKQVKKEKRLALTKVQSKTTVSTAKESVSTQKQDGSIELSETLSKNVDVSKESLTSVVHSYAVSEKVKKVKDDTIISTALAISYLKTTASAHEKHWKVEYEKARKYLSEKVKDAKLEEEILKSCEKLVVHKTTHKAIIKDKLKKKQEALTYLNNKTSAATVISIVSTQKSDGSIELSKDLSKHLEVSSSETLVTSIKSFAVSEKLKKLTQVQNKKLIESAVTISYLQSTASSQEQHWKVQYEKARKYLRNEIKDTELEEELLKACKKFVVRKSTSVVVQKQKVKQKRIALTIAQSKTTEETVKKIVTTQKSDGSFELSDEVSKQLDVSSTSTLVNTCRAFATNERVKNKVKDDSVWTTAVTINYLKHNALTYGSTWKVQYEHARKYLSKKVGDADLEEEILKTTKKVVVEKTTYKVTKEQKKEEKQAALSIVRSKTDVKSIKVVKESQNSDGSFTLVDTIAQHLDISSKETLNNSLIIYTTNETLKKYIKEKKLNDDVISTAVTISYLKVSGSTDESTVEYKKAREYLKKQINDSAIEEEVLKVTSKLVVDKSTKKVISKQKKAEKRQAISDIQKSCSPDKAQSIISKQKSDGSIELSDTVSKDLNINKENLKTTVSTITTNEKVKNASESAWTTALSLNYLKINSGSLEVKEKYDQAKNYLKVQLGNDEKAADEMLKAADKLVKEKIVVKQVEEKKQVVKQKALLAIQTKTTEETIKTVVSTQEKDGSFGLNDVVCKHLDIPSGALVTTAKKYVTSDKLKKIDNPKLFNTAITITYLENTSSARDSNWKEKYNQAREYLSKQIKDADLEEELMRASQTLIVESSTNVVRKQERQEKKDLKAAALISLQSKNTVEDTKKVLIDQKSDGSFQLSKVITEKIDVSNENLNDTVKSYVKSEKLKSKESDKWWKTALSIQYLKKTGDQHKTEWADKYDKAKKYLINEVKDEKLVEELLTASEKIIVEKGTEKVITDEKKAVSGAIKNSTSTEKVHEIISNQKVDGSLELTETVTKELDAESTESLASTVKSYFTNKDIKLPENDSIIKTAMTLSFLRKTSSADSSPEVKQKYEKAKQYLSTQIKDEKVEKELLEKTDQIVVDHATKKVVKEKAHKVVLEKVQETVTVEEVDKVTKTQNNDGSFEISEKITEDLEITTTKDIVSSIRVTDERVKKLDIKTWNTFITLAYCNKVLSGHESKWKVQNEKAREWLHKQIKDEKLEKEILESCEKVVVEKVSKKTIKQTSDKKRDQKVQSRGWGLGDVFGSISRSITTGVDSIYQSIDYSTRDETEEEKVNRIVVEKQQAAIVAVQTSTTLEKTTTIVSTQKEDGRFELSDVIRKKLDIASKETLITSIQSKTESESIKQISNSAWFSTALTICYLKTAAPQHKPHWNIQYERARKYLKEQIKDENLEEELLAVCSKYVITKATEKVEKKQTRKAITVIQSSTTLEKTKTIVSSQKEDGSIPLSSVITKKLDIESDKLVSTINSTCDVSDKLKNVADESIYSTAVSLNYLKIAANKYEGEWRTKYEESKKYLSKKLNSVELEEELSNVTNKFVIKKASEKVIRKEKQTALVHVQTKTTPQTAIVVCKTQKQDGSFDISETITKSIDVTSETVTSSVQPYIVNEKLKKVDSKLISTAITLSYLKTTATAHEKTWRIGYEKAREYLHKELNNEELESELLRSCEKYVYDKTTEKVSRKEKQKVKRVALAKIQSKTSVETTQAVVSSQKSDGSFELNKTVSDQLDITDSSNSLITTVKTYAVSEELKKHVDKKDWWSTALTINYLKTSASAHEDTWKAQYEKARKYLSEQVKDEKVVEEILKTSEKILVEKTTAKVSLKEKQKKKRVALLAVQSKTDVKTIKKVTSTQKQDGSFDLSEDVCKQVDVTRETLVTTVKNYAVSESLQKTISNHHWWSTALTLSYLKTSASAHEETWRVEYEKARKYLHEQINDDKLEEEILKTCSKIVVQKTTEKVAIKQKQKEKRDAITEAQLSTTAETTQAIITKQKTDGSFELSKEVSDKLDVSSENTLVSNIQKYTTNEKLKKNSDSSIWSTAATLSFLKNNATAHQGQWKDKYDQARKYLSEKVGDEKLEEEIIKTSDKFVIEKTALKQTKEKKNTEKKAALVTIQSKTNEETTKTVISTHDEKDGSFGLSEVVCKDLDVSSGTLTTTAKKYVTSEKLKKIENPKVFNTAVTIAYLQTTSPAHESQWKEKYEKARKYIKEQINDETLEEELLKASQKLVVAKTTSKVIREEKKNEKAAALVVLQSKTTVDTVKDVVSAQKSDGSIKLNKVVSEQIDVSSDNITSSVQTYAVSDKLKKLPQDIWETAISLSFLGTSGSQHQDQVKEQQDKARKYLSQQLKDEKLEKELLDASTKFVVEKSTKKVVNEEKKAAVTAIKSCTSPETVKVVVSNQKEDGSFTLDDKVVKDLEATSSKSLVSSVQTYFSDKKLKSPESQSLINTALSLSFLKKTAPSSEADHKESYEKARKYLSTQLGDEKLEKQLLETTDKFVVEQATKKVVKEKANQAVVNKVQESVTVEEVDKVTKTQNNDGSFEISEKITEDLEITTTKDIVSSIRVTDERVKKLDIKTWNTFITLAYCNKVLAKHDSRWKVQNEKAREWLHNQIKDEKLEKEILESCEKVVVEKISKKTIKQRSDEKKQQKEKEKSSWISIWEGVSSVGSTATNVIQSGYDKIGSEAFSSGPDSVYHGYEIITLQSKITPETTQKIVSTQQTDGSIKLNEHVTKQLDISSDNLKTTVQNYGISEQLKNVSHNAWETALNLRYLTIASKLQPEKYKLQSEKARQYLIEELKDDKLVNELLTTSDKIIIGQSVQKEKKDAVATVQQSTSTEKVHEIVSKQKDDGSLQLTEEVSKELETESNESLVSSVKSYFTTKGIKLPESKSIVETAMTLSFLRKTSSADSSPE